MIVFGGGYPSGTETVEHIDLATSVEAWRLLPPMSATRTT